MTFHDMLSKYNEPDFLTVLETCLYALRNSGKKGIYLAIDEIRHLGKVHTQVITEFGKA